MGLKVDLSKRKPFNTVVQEYNSDNLNDKELKDGKVQETMQSTSSQQDVATQNGLMSLREDMYMLKSKEEQALYACKNGTDTDSLELLKELVGKYESSIRLYSIVDKASQNCSLMHTCAKLNKVACIDFLLNNKVPIEGQDDLRATPLIYAVAHNSADATAYLLSKGCNVNAKDVYNKFSLLLALKNKNYEIVRMLSSCDVHLKGTKGNTVLHTMAQDGDLKAVQYLIEQMKASPFRRNTEEEHVLFHCLHHPHVTEYLCKQSTTILPKLLLHENSFSRTILGEAIISGNIHGLVIVLKSVRHSLSPAQIKTLLNHHDKNGDTPLILAVKNSINDMVQFLCRCEEVEINEPDAAGATALYYAGAVKDKELTAILTQYGASIRSNKEEVKLKTRNAFTNFCCSIRFYIILTAIVQVLVCCIAIWVISFTLSRKAQVENTQIIMTQVTDKTVQFMDSILLPPRRNVHLLANMFHRGKLKADRSSLPDLLNHAKEFNFASVMMGHGGHNNYYAVDLVSTINGTSTFIYREKTDNTTDLASYQLNAETETVGPIIPSETVKNYQLGVKDFYKQGMTANVGEGKWVDVFLAGTSKQLTILYTSPVQELVNGTMQKVGFVKNNVWIAQLDEYVDGLELVGNGYTIVIESNGNILATSRKLQLLTNTTTRANIFTVDDTEVTEMATLLKKKLGGTLVATKEQTLKLNRQGRNFIVRTIPYNLDNLRWSVLLVFYDSDLNRTSNIATYVTIGVTVFILLVGIISASLNGYLMTKPLIHLVNEFKKIANMDLNEVKASDSVFTEISTIFRAMDDMTTWLKEFRAFLPESILVKTETDQVKKKLKDDSSSSHSHSTDSSEHSTEYGKRNKFKVGLSGRVGTVLVVGINQIDGFYSLPPTDIVQAYSKFVTQVSTIVNQTHGIMQVLPQNLGLWVYWDRGQQEVNAVQTALNIIQYTEQLSSQLTLEGYPPLKVSCGVYTSPILSGNLGFANMKMFTLVGSLLTHAEQLQVYCQQMKLKIVCDEVTWRKCSGKFKARSVDILQIENQKVIIYEVIEKDDQADDWANELNRKDVSMDAVQYNQALSLISSARVLEAKDIFDKYLEGHPNDTTTKNWLRLIQKLEEANLVDTPINYVCSPKFVFSKQVNGKGVVFEDE
jgi:ankyrin repeat protein